MRAKTMLPRNKRTGTLTFTKVAGGRTFTPKQLKAKRAWSDKRYRTATRATSRARRKH